MLGATWGVVVFFLDTAKGFVAAISPLLTAPTALIAGSGVGLSESLVPSALAAGVASIVGHMFSPWARFKGGRGVATSLGVFLAVVSVPTAIALGVWILLFAFTRRVSVGSIGAALVYPFLILWMAPAGRYRAAIAVIGSLMALLILIRHIPNLKRLLQGTEPALVGRKTGGEPPRTDAGAPPGAPPTTPTAGEPA